MLFLISIIMSWYTYAWGMERPGINIRNLSAQEINQILQEIAGVPINKKRRTGRVGLRSNNDNRAANDCLACLKEHIAETNNTQCSYCSWQSSTSHALFPHIIKKHTTFSVKFENTYCPKISDSCVQCSVCNDKLKNRFNFKGHFLNKHSELLFSHTFQSNCLAKKVTDK